MRELLEDNPIIAAIKSDYEFENIIDSDCKVVFLLNGDILTLKNKIDTLHKYDKKVFIHIDMISGMASNPIVVDYIKDNLNADGIITTKINLVKRAKELKLKVIQRFFILDSMSLNNVVDSLRKVKPSAIEIMPGVISKVINKISNEHPEIPIICGGLIDKKEEVMESLKCGAMAVSTTDISIWSI